MTSETELYEAAVESWGEEAQFIMVVEELAELLETLQKYHRDRANQHDVIEEAADADIMVRQLVYMLHLRHGQEPHASVWESFHDARDWKLERLEERLEEKP